MGTLLTIIAFAALGVYLAPYIGLAILFYVIYKICTRKAGGQ